MIFRPSYAQFAPTLRLRLRSAGLGQSCPSGQIWDSGACVPDCSQLIDPSAQANCAIRRAAIWGAAAIAGGAPAAANVIDQPTGSYIQNLTGGGGFFWSPTTGAPTSSPVSTPPPPPATTTQQQQVEQQQQTLSCGAGSTLWNGQCYTCGPNFTFSNGVCVANGCPTGSVMQTDGSCVPCPTGTTWANGSCVVNPSPPGQTTNGLTSGASAGSTTSQANGTTAPAGDLLSTVGGYVTNLTTGPDLVPGIPNWLLLTGGVLAIAFVLQKK
jgi:hypothetical protein